MRKLHALEWVTIRNEYAVARCACGAWNETLIAEDYRLRGLETLEAVLTAICRSHALHVQSRHDLEVRVGADFY